MWRGWFLRDERRFDQSTYSLTMTKSGKQKARQIGICLLCAALTWRYAAGLEGTEFSGGRITGPLLDMFDCGGVLFVAAAVVTLYYSRVAAAIALAGSVLCLPLYLYFTAPGPFRVLLGGEYSVPLRANFELDRWSLAGIAVVAGTGYFCVRSLRGTPVDGRGRPTLD